MHKNHPYSKYRDNQVLDGYDDPHYKPRQQELPSYKGNFKYEEAPALDTESDYADPDYYEPYDEQGYSSRDDYQPRVEASQDKRRRNKPKVKPAKIDPSKVFKVNIGEDTGGFRHVWTKYTYGMVPSTGEKYVLVTFENDANTIKLYGSDAYNFLKLCGDINEKHFDLNYIDSQQA